MLEEIRAAVQFLQSKVKGNPEVGIILGTGLGNLLPEHLDQRVVISYNAIPHFPVTTVSSHKGQLIFGEIYKRKVLVMRGRLHYYEGYSSQQVTLPVRVMHMLGVKTLLVTNAAGNLNPEWKKGDLMLVEDHINLIPDNPLRGPNYDFWGPRFPDMSEPYDAALNRKMMHLARKHNIPLHRGIYAAVQGPNLETRAEYRYLRTIGADAVGMSTVPEVIVANHMGMRCCAVSVLTNDCYADHLARVEIQDIVEAAAASEGRLVRLFLSFLKIAGHDTRD
jgi:purine-nucleoside phosphorylase